MKAVNEVSKQHNRTAMTYGIELPPVEYEYRYQRSNYAWGEWERVLPFNSSTETVEDRVREIQQYILAGYKYQLRALYAGPVPDSINDTTKQHAAITQGVRN